MDHRNRWAWTRSMSAIGFITLCPLLSQAQNLPMQDAGAWRFQVTPYVWMIGMNGHVQPAAGLPSLHVDKSFSEIWDSLDAAFFLNATARKDRWVVHGDMSHAVTSDAAALPIGLTAQAKIKQTSVSMLGGYTWLQAPQTAVDVMAGVRWWSIRAQVQVPSILQASSNTTFADPVIAVRWHQDWAPRWSTVVYGDVGGFGVGSRQTWQALVTLNYQITPQAYVSVGYRHLSVDYRKNGKTLDFSMAGPMLGATWRF